MDLICDYVVPCLLDEEPMEHVTIYRDAETGAERTERVRLPHECAAFKALKKEQSRGF